MKRKLILFTALTMSVVLLALDVFIYALLAHHLDKVQEVNLANKVDAIVQHSLGQAEVGPGNPPVSYNWLRQYVAEGESGLILSATGTVVSSVGELATPPPNHIPRNPNKKSVRRIMYDNHTYIAVVEPIIDSDSNRLMGYAVLISNTASETDYMRILATVLIIGTVGAVFATSVGALFIAILTLRPLDKMMTAVTKIEASNLGERVPVPKSKGIVQAFAEAFNRMLTRIQRSFEQQTRFVADASHEIRTPLTNIQGYTNLLRRWGKHNPEILDECIEVIGREATRLQNLTDSLLVAARIEASVAVNADETTDVDDLLNDIVLTRRPLYPDRTLTSSFTSGAMVRMSPDHLQRVCSNLIDNALKYTPPGGSVTVRSTTVGTQVVIDVEDTGVGIPADEIPRVFERFYRVEKSRSKTSGGVGLGLALVKELVERHGGSVSLESELGVGTRVVVKIPIAPTPQ